MSSRWYPIYQRGNPQLRVFLPNFFMKLIKPKYDQAPNTVAFIVSMEMTRFDIKNYLEKIYNIPVMHVRTHVTPGETKRHPVKGYVIKEEDYKTAFVDLDKSVNFKFPDLFTGARDAQYDKDKKAMEESKHIHRKIAERNKNRPGLPVWFTM